MKKTVVYILAAVMTLALMTGCTTTKNPGTSPTPTPTMTTVPGTNTPNRDDDLIPDANDGIVTDNDGVVTDNDGIITDNDGRDDKVIVK